MVNGLIILIIFDFHKVQYGMNSQLSKGLAVVGARGVLGRAFLDALAQRPLPVSQVFALGSADCEGESVPFGRYELPLSNAAEFDFSQTEWVVMASLSPSAHLITERALTAGSRVLNFSPQANIPRYWTGEQLSKDHFHLGMPDAMSMILANVLRPILQQMPWILADIVSFEAVSSRGQMAVDELAGQTAALFNQQTLEQSVFEQRIAFNILPMNLIHDHQLTSELADGLSVDRKTLAVRRTHVPVFFGHCASIHLQFPTSVDFDALYEILSHSSGVHLASADEEHEVTPMTVTGRDKVFVAKFTPALDHANSVMLWCAADNARAGVALPALECLHTWLHA